MNNWEKTKNDKKFQTKLSKVKSTMQKSNIYHYHYIHYYYNLVLGQTASNITNSNNSKKKTTPNLEKKFSPQMCLIKKENYNYQTLLKRLLKEFGLSQYLRVKLIFYNKLNNLIEVLRVGLR